MQCSRSLHVIESALRCSRIMTQLQFSICSNTSCWLKSNKAATLMLTGVLCVWTEQQLQHLRSVRERLEAEVAKLQHSITTAHQDKAKAQAQLAHLQGTTACQDQADPNATPHMYAAASVPAFSSLFQRQRAILHHSTVPCHGSLSTSPCIKSYLCSCCSTNAQHSI